MVEPEPVFRTGCGQKVPAPQHCRSQTKTLLTSRRKLFSQSETGVSFMIKTFHSEKYTIHVTPFLEDENNNYIRKVPVGTGIKKMKHFHAWLL